MKKLQTYQVYPKLPEPLLFLEELVRNYWWSWNYSATDLFRRIDRNMWKASGLNPIQFFSIMPQQRLERMAADDSFLALLQKVRERYHAGIDRLESQGDPSFGSNETIAYLSMEFGIHSSLPIYSGGLGILAGDHLKAASAMGLPLTGVGLLYRQGYFHQYLDPNGWQQEEYPDIDLFTVPVRRARDPEGNEIMVTVPGPDGEIQAVAWHVQVGRTTLLLLDTYIQSNPPAIRDITARLYAGGASVRLSQEALLGIGGIQALEAYGLDTKVCHMNEGHAAFSGLERLARTMERHGVDLKTAHEIVARSTVFTTHTPVAAGHDEFPPDRVAPILAAYENRLGVSAKEILSWGQPAGAPADSPMSMFNLGLRTAAHCNGVSELHGKVARGMWASVWPGRPVDEVPISHITNGIHLPTWTGPELTTLFERYLGPNWHTSSRRQDVTGRVDEIYDEELWRAHEQSRTRLLRACREKMIRQAARRNAPKSVMEDAEAVLDNDALTIGFARRFATYKRAGLLLRDPDRLETLLSSRDKPVQIIFAGKAHPQDNEGKKLIQDVVAMSRRPGLRRKLIFLEDYDAELARHLVQGCDVWLNTPRRPFEACGTSGMKAALNGVLNLSILDGWWAEGYCAECGWAIGNGEQEGDPAYIDAVESQALYNLLENDVISKFYGRKNGDPPEEWVAMMKSSIKLCLREYNSLRMVNAYDEQFYIPAALWMDRLLADEATLAKSLAIQHERLKTNWPRLSIQSPQREISGPFRVGESFRVTTTAFLGELNPEEVEVHLYYGRVKTVDTVAKSHTVTMSVEADMGNGEYRYGCTVECRDPGRYAFTARITPGGDDWIKNTPGLITWA